VNRNRHKTAQDEAKVMFQRVVTGWAMDALSLRRRGLDRPSVREGTGLWVTPGRLRMVCDQPAKPGPMIRWRPRPDIAA
jgi:hypothetical protein